MTFAALSRSIYSRNENSKIAEIKKRTHPARFATSPSCRFNNSEARKTLFGQRLIFTGTSVCEKRKMQLNLFIVWTRNGNRPSAASNNIELKRSALHWRSAIHSFHPLWRQIIRQQLSNNRTKWFDKWISFSLCSRMADPRLVEFDGDKEERRDYIQYKQNFTLLYSSCWAF